jgi:hypothetical protein
MAKGSRGGKLAAATPAKVPAPPVARRPAPAPGGSGQGGPRTRGRGRIPPSGR